MKLILNEYNIPSGYDCDCGYYFDIANVTCWYCGKVNPTDETFRVKTILKRRGEDIPLGDSELFMEYFNGEKLAIRDLDFPALRERKESLKRVIAEAKIRVAAIDSEERERIAKVPKEKREWLVTEKGTNPITSDAFSKQRKQRQSKADKLANLLGSIGLSDDDELLTKVERKATGAAITTSSHRKIVDKYKPRTEDEDDDKPKIGLKFPFKKN